MEAQVTCTIQFADDLVLLAEEETVAQHTGLTFSVGRHCGMDANVGKTKVMRISRPSSPAQIVIGQKQLVNVE